MDIGSPTNESEVIVSDSLPPPADRHVYDLEQQEKIPKKKLGAYWNKPITKVYADNFGFSVNGYQPMIEYLDAKDLGNYTKRGNVHLPFLEERCMRKYSSRNPFKLYTNTDIDRFIDKGEKIRTQIRQNDAAGASNVHRRTHTNWSMTKKYVQLVKKSFVVDYRTLRDQNSVSRNLCSPSPRRPSVSASPAGSGRRSRSLSRSRCPSISRVMAEACALGSLAHSKLEHENHMAIRRERLRTLDDQFDDVINQMTSSVRKLSNKATQVATPFDGVKTIQDVMDATDDISLQNHMRRKQELRKLQENVDNIYSTTTQTLKSKSRNLEDEIVGMTERVAAMQARQRYQDEETETLDEEIARARAEMAARPSARRRLNEELDDEDISAYITPRRAPCPISEEEEPRTRKHKDEDCSKMSDVQARIMNRASELAGITHEARRINNMARFMNAHRPRPTTGDDTLLVPPSRVERNIDYMARSFASRGKTVRRFDIDDEEEPPVTALHTNMRKAYCTRESQKPPKEVPSNSIRVRNATIRARTRNALLGY